MEQKIRESAFKPSTGHDGLGDFLAVIFRYLLAIINDYIRLSVSLWQDIESPRPP
jgi:hypothetical protein